MEKIQELFGEGVRNTREMECELNVFAKNDIFKGESLPPQTIFPQAYSRWFFPERRGLWNHMYHGAVKLRSSPIDQELYIDLNRD